MSEADKLRAAVKDLQDRGLAPMHSTPENEAKAELSPFIKASKVVFDKSLELTKRLCDDYDAHKVVALAMVLVATGGILPSFITLAMSIGDPQVLQPLFGDTSRGILVVSSASSYAAFWFLGGMANNIGSRRPILNSKGLFSGAFG